MKKCIMLATLLLVSGAYGMGDEDALSNELLFWQGAGKAFKMTTEDKEVKAALAQINASVYNYMLVFCKKYANILSPEQKIKFLKIANYYKMFAQTADRVVAGEELSPAKLAELQELSVECMNLLEPLMFVVATEAQEQQGETSSGNFSYTIQVGSVPVNIAIDGMLREFTQLFVRMVDQLSKA